MVADEKWLFEDLLCICANAVKYSQRRSDPVVIAVAMVHVGEQQGPMGVLARSERASIKSESEKSLVAQATTVKATTPMLRFSVVDSGPALPPAVLSKLFDRPVQALRTQQGGCGLGLYCLCERVAACGGSCGARPRADGKDGLEVWFTLPLVVPTSADFRLHESSNIWQASTRSGHVKTEAAPVSPAKPAAGAGGQSLSSSLSLPIPLPTQDSSKSLETAPKTSRVMAQRIIVVDDSIPILKLMKRTIGNECPGVPVVEAKDGQEAFRLHCETPFDLICTDVQVPPICYERQTHELCVCLTLRLCRFRQMPNLDGFGLTRAIRSREKELGLRPTVIIGISANEQERIASEAQECGMSG